MSAGEIAEISDFTSQYLRLTVAIRCLAGYDLGGRVLLGTGTSIQFYKNCNSSQDKEMAMLLASW